MSDIIQKNKCCDFLLHEIAFYKDTIRPCCSFSIEDDNDITPFVNHFDGDIKKIENYFKVRNEFIETFKNGEKPVCFNGCTIYQSSKECVNSLKFTNIVISNRTKCSCNCMYCEQADYGNNPEYKAKMNAREPYDLKPALKYLMYHDYIEKNCRFLICGGECSEYPKDELEWLVYFVLINQGYILFLSSGLNYSEAIEEALKVSDSVIKVSVDSGTRETYEKIKRIKAFDRVWANVKKYIERTKEYNRGKVELKYIIVPGINDNKQEIKAFIDKCREINCTDIVLDIEHKWIAENKATIHSDSKIQDCLNYFFEEAWQGGKINNSITVSIEGVEEPLIWSLIDKKYNYKQGAFDEV